MTDYSTQPARRKLSDILSNNGTELREQWDRTEAAADFAPLPAGTYVAHVHAVQLFQSKTKCTPGVKVQFRICEGEHLARMIFLDTWLTPAALPQTKRGLAKLGITMLDQLETMVVPPGQIRCSVRVALRKEDDGEQYNRVRSFAVVAIDEPQADPFAPVKAPPLKVAEVPAPDVSLNFGANVGGVA